MKLLALDFDGVIADSAPEAFVVALRTWLALRPETALRERSSLMAGSGVPGPEAIEREPLYPAFLALMPLGNRAEDYGVALAALERGADLEDQAGYDAFRAQLDPAWLRSYHKRFYGVRAELAEADPEGWRRLMGAYPGLLEMLRRRAGDAILAIATAKDRHSVGELLQLFGARDLFSEGRVLDKETGVSKASHLEHLHRREGVAYSDMTFVDDKVNHLDSVAPLGVRCGLAAWGYNGPREIEAARARGYLVCSLGDAEAQLFGS